MHRLNFSGSSLAHVTSFVVSAFFLFNAAAWASNTERLNTNLDNNAEQLVFAGTCANNEPYRLVSYQKSVAGQARSFYDYVGPNGKGTVQSETQPKVMATRVCIKLAEIINANYWE
jgi:hypothetical protein